MDNQELRLLKELEEENRRLKHMYAELALDNNIEGCAFKKVLKPCQRKDTVTYVLETHHISNIKACRVVSLTKSMYYYKKTRDDIETITKVQELATSYPTEGQDLHYGRIRTQGYKWNYKRVRRVYRILGLNQRRKVRKRVPTRVKSPLLQPETPLEMWSVLYV